MHTHIGNIYSNKNKEKRILKCSCATNHFKALQPSELSTTPRSLIKIVMPLHRRHPTIEKRKRNLPQIKTKGARAPKSGRGGGAERGERNIIQISL